MESYQSPSILGQTAPAIAGFAAIGSTFQADGGVILEGDSRVKGISGVLGVSVEMIGWERVRPRGVVLFSEVGFMIVG